MITPEAMQMILKANRIMNVEQLELLRDVANAARLTALEEAADAVGEVGDHADCGSYLNAIRALVKG